MESTDDVWTHNPVSYTRPCDLPPFARKRLISATFPPHRASPSAAVSFKPEGSLSRRIDTKLPIREVLVRFVDMNRRLAGSHSKTPGEKGRLLDHVSKAVHGVLFAAYQCSGDPDSDDEGDPVTGGLEIEANITSLHQSGRQAHLGSRTHSNSDFLGTLSEITASTVRLTIRRQAYLAHHRTCPTFKNLLHHHYHQIASPQDPFYVGLERTCGAITTTGAVL